MKKILIVDDEKDLREILRINLEGKGFECLLAEDGIKALEIVRENRPDLIVLDLMMPDLPGEEVCKSIKADKETSSIPIIMLTSKTTDADKVVGRVIGADSYIFKPYDMHALIENINKLLGEKYFFSP
ncbi:response regulator transcription factor [Candidatus Omnitrophota bacterium]